MIFLRLATEDDLPLMLAWRSNPLIFEGFYQQTKPLTWEEHLAWWLLRNQDWRTFVIMLHEDDVSRPVGVITIGQLDNWSPEIGIYIGEVELWSKGIGKQALILTQNWLKEKGFEACHSTVLKKNERSIGLFEAVGFGDAGEARIGELRFDKDLTR